MLRIMAVMDSIIIISIRISSIIRTSSCSGQWQRCPFSSCMAFYSVGAARDMRMMFLRRRKGIGQRRRGVVVTINNWWR